MAAPLSADQIVAALTAEGVNVREYKSWRTHNRDAATGKTFGPVNGIVIHHTAGNDSLDFCYTGTADLPGPLCHTHLSKTGVATMVGHGRANHAGSFAQNAHDAVVAESPTHPQPDAAEPVDANDHYYGIEIENLGNGSDPYPAVQYGQAVRWAAALCRAHGWTADSVIGHKEGTRRKIDPSFGMTAFRSAIAERLEHPASWSPGSTTEEDPMAGMSNADICKAVWKTDTVVGVPEAWTSAGNPEWQPASILIDIGKRVRALQTAEAGQSAAIAALAKLVGSGVDTAAVVAAVQAAIADAVVNVSVDVTGTGTGTGTGTEAKEI
ncbi:N-acetylmuramoyl-L-alanine amidase [Streptomyces sp. DSM 3412]|uniref:N-acetylmuramoyl-L-alanine amidase n=1 Tax=Streptomyces gottesmaniae TaxID=3075518 RepID=A0ABU2YWY9_9ACTN|nr:N-acetylmuramoyl-L-alanine amidase [Streptomyces sp. DSM 3412]MDT0567929.1 N-acetylmuramoyl-L-alanine amidase [Streptomyces sp. DSM 3412]